MRIKSTLRAFVALALVVSGCASSPPPAAKHKFAAQTISASYDPSVSGLPGNVGEFVMELIGAGTTAVFNGSLTADTSYHDFALTGDGTTITGYEDTVMLASTATLTNVSNEPLILFVGNTTSGDSAMTKAVYCYIAP